MTPWLLIAAGLAAYHNTFAVPFLYDDHYAIEFNADLRERGPLPGIFYDPPGSPWSARPVASASFALNYLAGGLRVGGYHVVNLTLHVAMAFLLFAITRRTIARWGQRTSRGLPVKGLALSASLLWLVHPLLTESVTYIHQRSELLAAFFLMLTTYCVIRGAASSRPRPWYLGAVGSCLLGMGSKEVMVSAPLAVLLYDRMALADSWKQLWNRRKVLYLGLAATWLLLAWLVMMWLVPQRPLPDAGRVAHSVAGIFTEIPLWDNVKTQASVILHYLRLAVWPHPLVIDYGDWPIARGAALTNPALYGVAGLLGVTLWAMRYRPWLGLLGGWFFIVLAPSSSVVPISTELVAERRMYLPLYAVVIGVVLGGWWLLHRFIRRENLRRGVAVGLVASFALLLTVTTVLRNGDYETELRIWADTIAKRPANARAHFNLGCALAYRGRLEEADAQFQEARRLQPEYLSPYYGLGLIRLQQGRDEEALALFQEVQRWKPDYGPAAYGTGMVLARQGRYREAIAQFQAMREYEFTPYDANTHNNLGAVFASQGRRDEAISHFREALRLQPDHGPARRNLARLLAMPAAEARAEAPAGLVISEPSSY